MKKFDFIKSQGEVTDMPAVHKWLDNAVKHIMNGSYSITITKVVKKRSLNQNRLMWMWFKCMEMDSGQPSMDWHDHYCKKFLSREIVNTMTGDIEIVCSGTSNLNTEQMSHFLDQVKADALTEWGYDLPLPSDIEYDDFETQYKHLV